MAKGKVQDGAKKMVKAKCGKGVVKLGAAGYAHALKALLKGEGGRKDLKYDNATSTANNMMLDVPLEERAGYPVRRGKGSVDPKDWKAQDGRRVVVDFNRMKWLPDEWGQGVKSTAFISRSGSGNGGTYTVFISPDGKIFYHRPAAEKHAGFKFTDEIGFQGQVRKAKLQATQGIQLTRAEMKNMQGGGKGSIGFDSDASLFKVLSSKERQHVVDKEKFYFCVVSARRADKPDGIQNIFTVQQQLVEAGVRPTWYVDAESLASYKALGLDAVIGGKLTEARNKCLRDAKKLNKICVQMSDDISAWEYRDGPNAKERSDDAVNKAHANAKRLIISPAAAARFILAKMRGAEGNAPKLGGVYMLGSCARTFGGEAFSRHHFVIGDFFVVDLGSSVLFDEDMTLKEDYDFTAAHIRSHGSVLRCNRMTLNAKHYKNSGGAVSNRNPKEEQRNIKILFKKYPNCFRPNPKRENEVILSWPRGERNSSSLDDEDDDTSKAAGAASGKPPRASAPQRKAARAASKKAAGTKVKKSLKRTTPRRSLVGLPAAQKVLLRTEKRASAPYINARVGRIHGRPVEQVLGKLTFSKASGAKCTYSASDLRYDLGTGLLRVQ